MTQLLMVLDGATEEVVEVFVNYAEYKSNLAKFGIGVDIDDDLITALQHKQLRVSHCSAIPDGGQGAIIRAPIDRPMLVIDEGEGE